MYFNIEVRMYQFEKHKLLNSNQNLINRYIIPNIVNHQKPIRSYELDFFFWKKHQVIPWTNCK